ncbi:hypothetical protein CROQUDRAFT_710105 [Cronartium quercuum f. sp. fusiforme G11]|uniref:Alanine dehydrogenase/pyridine nucleotide transhydrogenase N-terminal domain-containing protein n=1 Tax=Cronartium quercuum f. sp. fusiforme G11 TaxID=708437 RepID=A0A9P6NIH4_9BASI|nr:hypothetical protein CROQUDRAFT_710105 [Cronartium quercuum f. sp. fusiforme G11]
MRFFPCLPLLPTRSTIRLGGVTSITRKPYSTSKPTILTLKAEHPSRLWERRTPLVPDDVARLLRSLGPQALTVRVESSPKRIYPDRDYLAAGANIVSPGTSDGDSHLVLAIKEIPIDHLSPLSPPHHRRTYCFFSHTHKGQSYNVPLLQKMVKSGDGFVDWELLLDAQSGKRTVSFGRLAGVVGAAEALSGLGIACLRHGISTPFLNLARPYTFRSEAKLMEAIGCLRDRIATEGYTGTHPLTVVVTGATGRVGGGAVEVLDQAGVKWASNLEEFRQWAEGDGGVVESGGKQDKLVGYKLRLEDHLVWKHASQAGFDRSTYDSSPHLFRSTFSEMVAPWTSLLINGAYWSSEFPRLLDNSEFRNLLSAEEEKSKIWAVTDISCDFQGGLEFVERATTIENPYAYLALSQDGQKVEEVGWDDPRSAVQLISIEILPSELAQDASITFSQAVVPYVKAFVRGSPSGAELRGQLESAMICSDGSLRPEHAGLKPLLLTKDDPVVVGELPRKVVLFGSGMVALPAIQTLLSDPRVEVLIASKVEAEAEALRAACGDQASRVKVVTVDVVSGAGVSELVCHAKVVVSLLPATMHPLVASHCLEHHVHLVTASYVSKQMEAFDAEARMRQLTFLNELGLDPGIDHMSAVRLMNRWRAEGWQVRSFVSFCGGLPEFQDGLLGYRFSWSPRGVLEALKNPAKFRLKGKQYEIDGAELLKRRFSDIGPALFDGRYRLEGLANRDSIEYIDRYGLEDDGLETMMRGTLRYEGFGEIMDVVAQLGLLGNEWLDGHQSMKVENGKVLKILKQLGVLPFGHYDQKQSPIEWLSEKLADRLKYRDGEQDMVLMSHELRLEKNGEQKRVRMWMEEKGNAMARTVGCPVGIGALVVMEDEDRLKGVVRPIEERLAAEVLKRLEQVGIYLREEEVKKNVQGIEDVLTRIVITNGAWGTT